MKDTMMALVAHAPYDYRYEEVPVPKVGPGEVLLKVRGCGVCAGDVKAYHGGIRIWGTTEANRYIEAPVITGHEFCGEIAELGEGVTGFNIGDFVVAEQILPCGECSFCREGKYWMCTRSAVYGFKQYCQGGFAEYVKLELNSIIHIIHRIPDSFSTEQGVLVEPIACGMHALELANIRHSDKVVIAGMGAIGLAMLSMANLYLPRMVIGVDVKEKRLRMGGEYGADYVLDPSGEDVAAKIKELTDGGCDIYVEASGSPASVKQGLEAIKNLGTYVQMGVFASEVTADWNVIGDGKEITIKGAHLSALTYPSVIKGIGTGKIKTDGLISHSFALKDWQEAFEVAEKDPEAIKVMLVP